jgi:crotonobetainyl-CoA:carnitine CoA-transferase CaiB-like acyl-CoA transferase
MTGGFVPRMPPRALEGVRVLDFSHVIAGPFATFQLAQLGADDTKVEKPGGGDVMRRTASGAPGFTALNAGKRIRQIDIASEAGRAEVLDLARHSDVMVDNYRPGVLRRHGLDYESVRSVNPRIVYCAISGYGHGDPARTSRGAYDHVIQALTGMTMLAGAEGDPPVKTGFPVVDAATGLIGALAIVIALRDRDRTGEGCFLDVSMWASALQLMYPFACDTLTSGQDVPRVGNMGYSGSPAADIFACRDGWLAIGANTPQHIERLMQVLGVPPAEIAPLLETPPQDGPAFARARDPQAFRALLAPRLGTQSAADLEQALNANGVPAARVRTLREFTREAVDDRLLEPVILGDGEARAITPGLGWRVVEEARPARDDWRVVEEAQPARDDAIPPCERRAPLRP